MGPCTSLRQHGLIKEVCISLETLSPNLTDLSQCSLFLHIKDKGLATLFQRLHLKNLRDCVQHIKTSSSPHQQSEAITQLHETHLETHRATPTGQTTPRPNRQPERRICHICGHIAKKS
jgi:hypothetical protein